jgi:uncharacterized membrane protein YphA (DoxX/SURF4 family)
MSDQRTDYAALLLRLSLGTMFVAHALLKVIVFTVPGTVQFFQSLGDGAHALRLGDAARRARLQAA